MENYYHELSSTGEDPENDKVAQKDYREGDSFSFELNYFVLNSSISNVRVACPLHYMAVLLLVVKYSNRGYYSNTLY